MENLTNQEIVLAGLGATSPVKQAARSEIGASLYRKHFLERIHLLPEPLQKALKEGKAQISDAPFYATAEIKGTRAELIKLSIPEELGITNIDNGKLGKDRYFTLSALRLYYDALSITGKFIDPYPATLLNGEWELEIDGRNVLEKQPIRKFHDGIFGYNTQQPFGLYVLDNPKLIEPQTPVEFNVSVPDNLPGFLKIMLEGTTVYSN